MKKFASCSLRLLGIFTGLMLCFAGVSATHAGEVPHYKRIVSLGPDVTEIAMALGRADQIIAVDRSSRYPEQATTKPDVGYRRALSAENILALAPDLILAAEDIGPPEALDVLKASGVPLIFVPEGNSDVGISRKIEVIAATLDRKDAGETLARSVMEDFRKAAELGASV